MKRTIISTISVVVLSTVLSGCMDKLEILPNDQIITENFFEEGSPEEIESGVNSMYQRLQSSYMYNLRMWTLDIVAGEGRVGNEAGGITVVLYLALVSAVAYTLWSVLLAYNDVSKVAIFGFVNPLCSVILSALVLGEVKQAFNIGSLIALALVCVGIYIVNAKKNNKSNVE